MITLTESQKRIYAFVKTEEEYLIQLGNFKGRVSKDNAFYITKYTKETGWKDVGYGCYAFYPVSKTEAETKISEFFFMIIKTEELNGDINNLSVKEFLEMPSNEHIFPSKLNAYKIAYLEEISLAFDEKVDETYHNNHVDTTWLNYFCYEFGFEWVQYVFASYVNHYNYDGRIEKTVKTHAQTITSDKLAGIGFKTNPGVVDLYYKKLMKIAKIKVKYEYPIILTPDIEGFTVYIPDFEINTQGDDIHHAIQMAKDAICLMGIDMLEDNKPVPLTEKQIFVVEVDFDSIAIAHS